MATVLKTWSPRFWNGTTTSKDVDGLLVFDPTDEALSGGRTAGPKSRVQQFFSMAPAIFPMLWAPRSFDGVSVFGHDFDGIVVADPDPVEPRMAYGIGRYDSEGIGANVSMLSAPRYYNGVSEGKDLDGSVQLDPEQPASERRPAIAILVPTLGIATSTWPISAGLFLDATDIKEMDPKSP